MAYRSSAFADWPTTKLLRAKGDARVTVVVPARNEEATVGAIVAAISRELMDRARLVDEIIVVDSRSTDRTAKVAEALSANLA
jgi:glucosyl-3-phosphoglycerate synthase